MRCAKSAGANWKHCTVGCGVSSTSRSVQRARDLVPSLDAAIVASSGILGDYGCDLSRTCFTRVLSGVGGNLWRRFVVFERLGRAVWSPICVP